MLTELLFNSIEEVEEVHQKYTNKDLVALVMDDKKIKWGVRGPQLQPITPITYLGRKTKHPCFDFKNKRCQIFWTKDGLEDFMPSKNQPWGPKQLTTILKSINYCQLVNLFK